MKKIIPNDKKSQKKKMKPWKKKLLIAFGIIFLIGISVFGYFAYRANKSINNITGENQSIFDTARSLLSGATNKQLKSDNGRTNIVLLGMRGENDPNGGLLADSIMILSIQQESKKVAMVSIPRDLRVEVPGTKGYSKLNAANAIGFRQKPPQGLQYTMKVLEDVTGMPMHYGISVDFIAFKGIIDALGGITVNAESDFFDPNYDGGIRVKKGLNDLDSDRALKYVQARLTSNDFDRSRRQREVMTAIKDKAEQSGAIRNPMFMLNLLENFGTNVRTTMTVEELRIAVDTINALDINNMVQKGYDTSSDGPFTSQTLPSIGYVIIPRSGNFTAFQKDIQGIFDIETTEPQQ
jgi:polyisoprenyl-teichoic acid--peptidoglycan teichoic acid transferase